MPIQTTSIPRARAIDRRIPVVKNYRPARAADNLSPCAPAPKIVPKPRKSQALPFGIRVAEAREEGAVDYRHTLPGGADVFAYCKGGADAYEVRARRGLPLSCTCPDFGGNHATGYRCKHLEIYLDNEAGTLYEVRAARARAAAAHPNARVACADFWRCGGESAIYCVKCRVALVDVLLWGLYADAPVPESGIPYGGTYWLYRDCFCGDRRVGL